MKSVWPVLCITGVILGSFHPILINLGKDDNDEIPFSSASVALCIETTKFIVSVILAAKDLLKAKQNVGLPLTSIILFAIPALLYTVVNNLVTHSQKYMDPSSFQIMNNLKIITTAFLYKVIINRPINQRKWMSIFLLFLGGTINSLAGLNREALKQSTETVNKKEHFITWTGIYMVVFYCIASGLAGVYTEAVLKKYKQASINMQNSILYFFGIFSNALIYMTTRSNNNNPLKNDFFHGFSSWTWLIVFTQALNGLIISLIMKHLSNIVRLLMIGSSMVLTTILSYIIFGYNIDIFFALAFIFVMSALILYHTSDRTTKSNAEKSMKGV